MLFDCDGTLVDSRVLWFVPHGAPTRVPAHSTAFSGMDRLVELIGR